MTRLLAALRAFGAVLILAAAPAAAEQGGFTANDVDFLNMMGNLEGPRGFGTVSDFVRTAPPAEIDEMRIGDVLSWQRAIRARGVQSSAVGRYQFIHVTLLEIVQDHGISADMVFDGEVQTFLARLLMDACGFYDPDTPIDTLGNCLAGRWAALPRLAGPGAGRSAYHGDGLNHHLVSAETFRNVLQNRFLW